MVQIPHDHTEWHERLGEILIALSKRPSPSSVSRIMQDPFDGWILWSDLPGYQPEFCGTWIDAASTLHAHTARQMRFDPDFQAHYDLPRDEWTNSNAFVARLVTKKCPKLDYEVYAIDTMRTTLEEELNADDLWMNIPGAVVWILYAGDFLYRNARYYAPPMYTPTCGTRSYAYGGSLYDGPTGFCRDRWNLWHERFNIISAREDIDEATRSWIKRALSTMMEIGAARVCRDPLHSAM